MRIKGLTIAALAAALVAGCQGSGRSQTVSPTLVPADVPVPTPRPTTVPPVAPTPTVAPTAPAAAAPAAAPSAVTVPDEAGFQRWLADFRARAAARGISEATLALAFDNARLEPEVIELDQQQPEFNRAVWDYLDRAVSQDRIGEGGGKAADHRRLLDDIEAETGVPAEIVVAVWGIESNYGGNFGSFHVIDALATLAYEGRRRDFAEEQLMAALRILEAGDIDRDRMIGSWAGAMGHTQFLPSVFFENAVDYDGDGRRDIWGSIPDVLASTAKYLQVAGWRRGEPWGVEIVLPPGFDYGQAELSTTLPAAGWAGLGVRSADGSPLPAFAQASVITPGGARGPAFLVGPNFRVILRYNNSTSYALAVGHLADRLAGSGPIAGAWPREEEPLSRSQIVDLQTLLIGRGYALDADGLVGPQTREAIRAWQRSQGQVPDGFATVAMLRQLQAGG